MKKVMICFCLAVMLLLAYSELRPPRNRGECYQNCEQAFRGNPAAIANCKRNCDKNF